MNLKFPDQNCNSETPVKHRGGSRHAPPTHTSRSHCR